MIYKKNVHFAVRIKLSKKASNLKFKGIYVKIVINNFKAREETTNCKTNSGMNMCMANKQQLS